MGLVRRRLTGRLAVAQEREAYAHIEYADLLRGLMVAIEKEETLKWMLSAAQMKADIWRSEQASERLGRDPYDLGYVVPCRALSALVRDIVHMGRGHASRRGARFGCGHGAALARLCASQTASASSSCRPRAASLRSMRHRSSLPSGAWCSICSWVAMEAVSTRSGRNGKGSVVTVISTPLILLLRTSARPLWLRNKRSRLSCP